MYGILDHIYGTILKDKNKMLKRREILVTMVRRCDQAVRWDYSAKPY